MQFVTFRLYGSLPRNRIFPIDQVTSSGEAFVHMDRLLDQARFGPTFLKEPSVAQTVQDIIEYGVRLGHYDLHTWVIMPNHVHLLITPKVGLSAVLQSIKGFSAKRANEILSRTGHPFWQRESYDHLVRNNSEAERISRYIELNPIKAGLAAKPGEYK